MLHCRRHFMLAAGAVGAVVVAVAGCAGLMGPPTLWISEGELAALARREFPLDRRLLDVLETRVSNPRLQLLSDRNRIAAQLDIAARDRVFGGSWQGELDFDAALRWEAADQTLRLDQVQVRDLRLATRGDAARTAGERLGAAMAERVLDRFVLYRLPADRAAELQRQGLRPDRVRVTPRGVEVTFAALARH
jgi:hypothetical protein